MLGIIVCQLQPSKSTFELNTEDLQLRPIYWTPSPKYLYGLESYSCLKPEKGWYGQPKYCYKKQHTLS